MMGEPFTMIPNRVIDARPGAAGLAVYVVLAFHGRNHVCHPGLRRIAQLTGLDVKTVRRAIDVLLSKGLITVVKHANGQRQEYRMTVGTNPTVQAESVGASPTVVNQTVGTETENRGNWNPEAWEPVPHNKKELDIEQEKNSETYEPDESEPTPTALWERVKTDLQKQVNQHSFETWLKPTKGERIGGSTLTVRVPTADFEQYLATKYGALVHQVMADLGLQCSVKFRAA